MQLPIDIKALLDEMTNIREARNTEISLSVYLDRNAPIDLVAHVRSAFASAMPNVRMTISYLDASFLPHPHDDLALLVAGSSRGVGAAAAALRAVGVPVAVVTTAPKAVGILAERARHAIPEGDLLSPDLKDAQDEAEPVALTEERTASLDERIGRWVAAICHEKRLAYSIAFPFMRRPLAKDAVQTTSLQNAGIGLVPFIPGADLPIMTLNQAKMLLQIAAAYGEEMDKNRLKELAAVVGGAYLCRVVARGLVEFVPVLGFAIRPGIAYGGTSAVGYAAIEYYEGGEDIAGVANVATRAFQKGSTLVSQVRDEGPAIVPKLLGQTRDKLVDAVPRVQGKVHDLAPKVVAVVDDLAGVITNRQGA